jgi:curved DNA-binding protein
VLGDPEKRKKYDELGANWKACTSRHSKPAARPSARRRLAGPLLGRSRRVPHDRSGGDAPDLRRRGSVLGLLQDVLRRRWYGAAEAGQAQPAAVPRKRRGRDVEHEIELSLAEGSSRRHTRLSIRTTGRHTPLTCAFRRESRRWVARQGPGAGSTRCRRRILGRLCTSGFVWRRTSVFERQGNDLRVRVAVPVTTAVLGGEAEVPTLDRRRRFVSRSRRPRRTARSFA